MRVSEIRVKQIRVNQGLGVVFKLTVTLYNHWLCKLPGACQKGKQIVVTQDGPVGQD